MIFSAAANLTLRETILRFTSGLGHLIKSLRLILRDDWFIHPKRVLAVIKFSLTWITGHYNYILYVSVFPARTACKKDDSQFPLDRICNR